MAKYKEGEIERITKEIISQQINVDLAEVADDASLVDDLGADSLDTVELVMELEEAFDLEITDEDAESLETVEDVITFIKSEVED